MGVSTAHHSHGLVKQRLQQKQQTAGRPNKPVVHKRSRPVSSAKRPRTVRFNVEANQVKEITTRNVDVERSSLFWTREERNDILDSNHRLAQAFRQHHPLAVEMANQVFDDCCDDAELSIDSDDSDEERNGSGQDVEGHDFEDVQDCARVLDVPTHVRGLEWGFLPASKRYRRTHVQHVLRVQQRIWSSGKDDMELLGQRAVRSSRPSRVMARIIGEHDSQGIKEPEPATRRHRYRMLPSWW